MIWTKIVNYLQSAIKAGKVLYGSALFAGIRNGKVKMVIYSCAMSENSIKKIRDKTSFYHVPAVCMPAKDFDRITSRPALAYGLIDAGFVKAIRKVLEIQGYKPEEEQKVKKMK